MVSHLSSTGFFSPLYSAREWLRSKGFKSRNYEDKVVNRFWELFLQNISFNFSHTVDGVSETQRDSPASTVLYFSYRERGRKRRESATRRWGLGNWDSLKRIKDEFSIPNEVLVIRKSTGNLIFDEDLPPLELESKLSRLFAGSEWSDSDCWSKGIFTAVDDYDQSDFQSFEDAVSKTFGHGRGVDDTELTRYWNEWFVNNNYRFTVDEVITFLRQDQRSNEREDLALVLPGGGVRAAFQARMLDKLYATENSWLYSKKLCPPDDPTRTGLCVEQVIGTSGGALAGLFAATQGSGRSLSSMWGEDNGTLGFEVAI